MRLPLAILAAATALAASNIAAAGATTPLSAIPALPSPTAVRQKEPGKIPGILLKTSTIGGTHNTRWNELVAATGAGYCVTDSVGLPGWMASTGASENGDPRDFDLTRIHEEGEKLLLDRTAVHYEPKIPATTAVSHLQTELKEVARGPSGVVVYAYREHHNVMLLARHVTTGREARALDGSTDGVALVEGCLYGGVRLAAPEPGHGTIGQLVVELPLAKGEKTPETFVIDASLSKFARDPEPTLAVRIRRSKEGGDP